MTDAISNSALMNCQAGACVRDCSGLETRSREHRWQQTESLAMRMAPACTALWLIAAKSENRGVNSVGNDYHPSDQPAASDPCSDASIMNKSDVTEAKIRALEEALAAATESWRSAKQAVKHAKEDAKLAKKQRKRARKALIEAQEAAGASPEVQALAASRASRGKIADSPEPRKKARQRKKGVPRADRSDTGAKTESATSLSSPIGNDSADREVTALPQKESSSG